jgi:hypothetical protein
MDGVRLAVRDDHFDDASRLSEMVLSNRKRAEFNSLSLLEFWEKPEHLLLQGATGKLGYRYSLLRRLGYSGAWEALDEFLLKFGPNVFRSIMRSPCRNLCTGDENVSIS